MFVVIIHENVVTTLWYLMTTVLVKVEIYRFYCWFYCVTVNLLALVEFWTWFYVRKWYITAFVLWWWQWWLGQGWCLIGVGLDFTLLLYDGFIVVIIRIINFILAVHPLPYPYRHYLPPTSTIINSIMRPYYPYFIINLFVLHHYQPVTNTLFVSFPPFDIISLLFFLFFFLV